jgi:ribonucleoside-diphosphate reductase alpha chain
MVTTVKIDYSRDSLLTPFGITTLADRYFADGEKSPQDAFARAAEAFSDSPEMAQRIYDYASKLWFMFSTPILSNGGTKRGMPISCFLNFVPDSRGGLTGHYTENAWLSSMGGGIGGYWGRVRSNGVNTSGGSRSSGAIPFLKVVDAEVLAFAQGVTRRASYAAYLDISHPEIEEFLEMRKPSGGDSNRRCLNLHHGVNITDAFMVAVERGADWDLIDPHSKVVVKTLPARDLWQRLLDMRMQTGEPYIHFIDASNRALPESQKQLGLAVHQSNLCSEITLPTNDERTAVCCLSSVNLATWDEWKDDPQFIKDLVRFLDNVLSYFIENAPPELSKAVYSASQERSIGLGAMGFHALLQSYGLAFDSPMAVGINHRIFKHIKEQASRATRELAGERGAAPDSSLSDPVRNMHLMAIAPNASSSIICGDTSPSIEPYRANAYTAKTKTGSFLVKNPYLTRVLAEMGKDTHEVWSSIITNGGSVQHLQFLDETQKGVFKTAIEIDQRWIVDHAAERQEYICQAQSVNVFLPANADVTLLHHVHFRAWKKGLKSLYYLRSEAIRRAETVSTKIARSALNDYEGCLSCEG